MGQNGPFYTPVLITNVGRSAFCTGCLVNKPCVPDWCQYAGHPLISGGYVNGVTLSYTANNVVTGHTAYNASSQTVCVFKWVRLGSGHRCARPVPARRAEKKGADSAGMEARNRSGQMGQYWSAGAGQGSAGGGHRLIPRQRDVL